MARLRFPGRPGCRFDRFGVHYNSDEHYSGSDATTQIVSNIHRGLRVFRELFGESDEEEFEGFTQKEIRAAERKYLKGVEQEEAARSRQLEQEEASRRRQLEQVEATRSRQLVHAQHTASAVDRKQNNRQFVEELVHSGVAKHGQPLIQNEDIACMEASMKPGYALEIPRPGLFEQPVVVEGKRHRKLSAKMMLRLNEDVHPTSTDNVKSAQSTSPNVPAKACADTDKLHEQNIVRKARFHLNRAAMNKSKNALARSLKRKMEHEERLHDLKRKPSTKAPFLSSSSAKFGQHDIGTTKSSSGESSASTPRTGSTSLDLEKKTPRDLVITMKPVKKYHRKDICAVCARPVQRTKNIKYTTYHKVPCCTACYWFASKYLLKATYKDFKCLKNDRCSMKDPTVCRSCRFRKSKRVFFGEHLSVAPPDVPITKQSEDKLDVQSDSSPEDATAEDMTLEGGTDTENIPVESPPRTVQKTTAINKHAESHQRSPTGKPCTILQSTISDVDLSSTSPHSPGFSPTKAALRDLSWSSVTSPPDGTLNLSTESMSSDLATSPEDTKRAQRGPRIKHVCRKSSVALGKRALFPDEPEVPRSLRLSALPADTKQKLLENDNYQSQDDQDSDDMSIEEIIKRARDDRDEIIPVLGEGKGKKGNKGDAKQLLYQRMVRKKKGRCGKCPGCMAPNCQECRSCKDMRRYGGPSTLKQACEKRVCSTPKNAGDGAKTSLSARSGAGKAKKHPGVMEKRSCDEKKQPRDSDSSGEEGSGDSPTTTSSGRQVTKRAVYKSGDTGASAQSPEKGKRKRAQKATTRESFTSLQSVVSVNRTRWASEESKWMLKTNYEASYDLDTAWTNGMSLLSSAPLCTRTLCYLCGSTGQHEFLYCAVCCESFHVFCLERCDRPQSKSDIENWLCKRCQYCHVCGKRNKLLKCDKCQESFHSSCLGNNHPTKRSKNKNIWLCTKCVKCRSCGSHTPGADAKATWTHDFSLCYDCGQNMDLGNFCPVCHKTYADDDWNCKMVQCSICENWVHANCEGMSDEMYQLLSFLPEDTMFNCSACCPQKPAQWQTMVERERNAGLRSIMQTLGNNNAHRDLINLGTAAKSDEPLNVKIPGEDNEMEIDNKMSSYVDTGQSNEASATGNSIISSEQNADVKPNENLEQNDVKPNENCEKKDDACSNVEPEKMDVDELKSDADKDGLNDSVLPEKDASEAGSIVPSRRPKDIVRSVQIKHQTQVRCFTPELPDCPKDLKDVKIKIAEAKYNAVDEFCKDIVRILQYNLDCNEAKATSAQIMKSVFIKKISSVFPWFDVNDCKMWHYNQHLPDGLLPDAVVPPSLDHTYAQWLERPSDHRDSPQPSPFKANKSFISDGLDWLSKAVSPSQFASDNRRCVLCTEVGDSAADECGRLLYAYQDDWIHVNCAIWSAEVYESQDGALLNVHTAVVRGRQMKCSDCNQPGATVGCCYKGCLMNFHYACARKSHCIFQEDKNVFCYQHRHRSDGELHTNFEILRRTYISYEIPAKQVKKSWTDGVESESVNLTIGSMTVESLGTLKSISDFKNYLIPINFSCTRVYWSTNDARKRTVYTCRVTEIAPHENAATVIKDTTIIHDKLNPAYSEQTERDWFTLSQKRSRPSGTHNRSTNSDSLLLTASSCEDSDVVFDTSATSINKFKAPLFKAPGSMRVTRSRASRFGASFEYNSSSSGEPSTPTSKVRTSTPKNSASTPNNSSLTPSPSSQSLVNLSNLSDSTKQLLKQADLSKYSVIHSQDRGEPIVKRKSLDVVPYTSVPNPKSGEPIPITSRHASAPSLSPHVLKSPATSNAKLTDISKNSKTTPIAVDIKKTPFAMKLKQMSLSDFKSKSQLIKQSMRGPEPVNTQTPSTSQPTTVSNATAQHAPAQPATLTVQIIETDSVHVPQGKSALVVTPVHETKPASSRTLVAPRSYLTSVSMGHVHQVEELFEELFQLIQGVLLHICNPQSGEKDIDKNWFMKMSAESQEKVKRVMKKLAKHYADGQLQGVVQSWLKEVFSQQAKTLSPKGHSKKTRPKLSLSKTPANAGEPVINLVSPEKEPTEKDLYERREQKDVSNEQKKDSSKQKNDPSEQKNFSNEQNELNENHSKERKDKEDSTKHGESQKQESPTKVTQSASTQAASTTSPLEKKQLPSPKKKSPLKKALKKGKKNDTSTKKSPPKQSPSKQSPTGSDQTLLSQYPSIEPCSVTLKKLSPAKLQEIKKTQRYIVIDDKAQVPQTTEPECGTEIQSDASEHIKENDEDSLQKSDAEVQQEEEKVEEAIPELKQQTEEAPEKICGETSGSELEHQSEGALEKLCEKTSRSEPEHQTEDAPEKLCEETSGSTLSMDKCSETDNVNDSTPTNTDVHNKIFAQIKAKSIAHSATGEGGPLKCDKCKRKYRTPDSYEKHVADCTFYVSSSSDDESSDSSVQIVGESQIETPPRMSMTKMFTKIGSQERNNLKVLSLNRNVKVVVSKEDANGDVSGNDSDVILCESDESGVDSSGVDSTGVDSTGVDSTGVDSMDVQSTLSKAVVSGQLDGACDRTEAGHGGEAQNYRLAQVDGTVDGPKDSTLQPVVVKTPEPHLNNNHTLLPTKIKPNGGAMLPPQGAPLLKSSQGDSLIKPAQGGSLMKPAQGVPAMKVPLAAPVLQNSSEKPQAPGNPGVNRKIKVVVKSNKREKMKTVTVIHSNNQGTFDSGTNESTLKVPMDYNMKNIMAHIKETMKNAGQSSKLSIQSMVTKVVPKNANGVPIGPAKIVESRGAEHVNGVQHTSNGNVWNHKLQGNEPRHVKPNMIGLSGGRPVIKQVNVAPAVPYGQKFLHVPAPIVAPFPEASGPSVVGPLGATNVHEYAKVASKSREKREKYRKYKKKVRDVPVNGDVDGGDLEVENDDYVPPWEKKKRKRDARSSAVVERVVAESLARKRKASKDNIGKSTKAKHKGLREQNFIDDAKRSGCHRIRPKSMLPPSQEGHHLVHSRKKTCLPQAAIEEEVASTVGGHMAGRGPPGAQRRHASARDPRRLQFHITNEEGFEVKSDTWQGAWNSVIDKIQDARTNARMKQLDFGGVDGLAMYGLAHDHIRYLTEQLPGAHTCRLYNFKYHHYDESFWKEPEENPSGCARGESFLERNPRDMFSFLLSQHRVLPGEKMSENATEEEVLHKSQRRPTSMALPMAMRFRHLRSTAREAVGVYRSPIHGRGLFCKRDISAGEMVIEYAGEIVRSILTDKREQEYESKGIGCYMFRIDDYDVIDATVMGNAARFINHCCEPNCYSKVITIGDVKHIIIFAMKAIRRGEELTYDYKFPIEEVKILCSCSAKKCRKYLN